MRAQRAQRKPSGGLLRRYWMWIGAIAVLSVTWHLTHPGTRHIHERAARHRQQAQTLLTAMEHTALNLQEKAGKFEKHSLHFNLELSKQNQHFANANQVMAEEQRQREAQEILPVNEGPILPPPAPASVFISERSRRKEEFIREQAKSMFRNNHHAAKEFIRREIEKLRQEEEDMEEKAARKQMQPHILHDFEVEARNALIAEKEANRTGHRHRPHHRHKAKVPGAPPAPPPPPFQSGFAVRLVQELINRMRAEGKDIDQAVAAEDLEAAVLSWLEEEAALMVQETEALPRKDGKPAVFESTKWAAKGKKGAPGHNEDSEGEGGAGRADSEDAGDDRFEIFEGDDDEGEDDVQALEKMAEGVVDETEALMVPQDPGAAARAPPAAAGRAPAPHGQEEGGVLGSWVTAQQAESGEGPGLAGAAVEDEHEEAYNVKEQQAKMRALVKAAIKASKESSKRAQPPSISVHASAGAEEDEDEAPGHMAQVMHRCMGAPAPWMPRPYGYRKRFRAYERAMARREERENPKAPPPPPADVTYYKVPKRIGVYEWLAQQNSKVRGAWWADYLTKNEKRFGDRNKKHVTADRSGKAVVVDGSLVYMSDKSYREYRDKYMPGRTLLASKGKSKLYQISSFCSGKLQHRPWQSCVAAHARERCASEARKQEEPKPYTSELAGCVMDTQHCDSQLPHLRHLTSRLPSVAALALSSPGCLLQNDGSESCGALGSNQETAGYMGRCGKRGGGPGFGCDTNVDSVPVLDADMQERWDTCAVVGSSPGLFKQKNGLSIDGHDAVFRVFDKSPGHIDNKRAYNKNVGKRTTVAVLGRGAATELLQEDEILDSATEHAEYAVFWHYHSVQYLEHLQETYHNTTIAMMSPQLVNWQLRMYGHMKSDLERIGLGPLPCARFMSTGMHALLMALQTCHTVNLFGFSAMPPEESKWANSHKNASELPLETYSVVAEARMLRLLWLAGAADMCTTDV